MKMSEEEKEEMTDWLIAREECVEEEEKQKTDLTAVYLKGYADAEEKCRDKIKKLEEENRLQRSQLNSAFNNGFIPKQKVKDKIEEIKQNRRELGFKTYLKREDMINEDREIVVKMQILQELLQEEDK